MKRFDGKVAVVTGGGTGIGRATAIQMAAEGARVVIGNRNEDAGRAVVRAIEEAGDAASFLRTDVAHADQVQALIDHAIDRYGALHLAFNNAGVEGPMRPITEVSPEEFDQVMAVNVRGVFLAMRAEIPHILAAGGGAIVNTSSVAGLIGFPGQAAYSTAKHAVVGMSKTAALEYGAHGVRVNAVCPAAIKTEMFERFASDGGLTEEQLATMHPIGRIGRSPEVAQLVCWLLSDEASFMLGQAVPIDGGYTTQ